MRNNRLFSTGAIAQTVFWTTLISALCAGTARAQITNVVWNRQALGQTVGGTCGPVTNLVNWSATYPNNNNWSQSVVYGNTPCGSEIVEPSNWSIPVYPDGTNYDVLIGPGGVVNLDVSVTLNDLTIEGAELQITSQSTLQSSTLELDGGTITGTLQNTGTMTVSNGNYAGLVGNRGNILLVGDGTNILANQTTVNNQGLVQQTNSGGLGFNGYGGGTTAFYNMASGTFQFLNDSPIFVNNCCGATFFENAGLVWKSGGSNDSVISVAFNNQGGAIQVDTGTLTLSNGGVNSNGTFTVASGATLDLTGGGNPTWAGLMTGAGAGQVSIGSGTISADPGLTLIFTSNLFNPSGGTLAGPILNNGIVTSVGTNAVLLANESTFSNSHLFQLDGSGGLGYNGYGGGTTAFDNLSSGTFQFLTDSSIFQNSCCGTLAFNNVGVLWKSGGTNTTVISVPFNNSGGTIKVDSGKLVLSGGGINTNGTFVVTNGATLDLTGGSNPTWAGQINQAGGGNLIVGTGKITARPSLTLNNGLVNIDTAGGTLDGVFDNRANVTSTGTNATILANQATFSNDGFFELNGSGGLGFDGYGGGTTTFNNQEDRRFEFLTDSSVFQNNCCGTLAFNNEGEVLKSGGTNSSIISVPFNNLGGSVFVLTGELTLSGGGSSSNGMFGVSPGAVLDLTGGGSPIWAGTMSGNGDGLLVLQSGTILAQPQLTLDFPDIFFHWNGGNFAGKITNDGVVNLASTNAGILANQSAFFNNGTVHAVSIGGLGFDGYGGGTTAFYNLPDGVFEIDTNSPIFLNNCCGTVFVENQGTFWKNGSATSTVSVNFNNLGGTFMIDGGLLILAGGGSSSNATISLADNGALDLTGGNNSTYWTGKITGLGMGTVFLSSGTIIANGLALNFATNVFEWNGGTISGSVTNLNIVNCSGTASNILANQSSFYNQGLVRATGRGGFGLDGYGGGTTAFYNLPGATYKFLTDSPIFLNNCCGNVFFENQGLLWKGGGSSNTVISVDFNSAGGTVQVDTGRLTLAGGGNSSNATFTVASGASVDLTGGSDPIWAGQINGSGAGSVFLSSGTITATPILTLALSNNLFQWSGGTFTGVVSNAGVLTLNGSNTSILANQSTFYNNGLVLHAGIGALGLNGYGGGTTAFYNLANGIYQFETDSSVVQNNCCGTLDFYNDGLVRKSGGTNISAIAVPFVNMNGSVEVDSGTLSLNGSPYAQGSGALTVSVGGSNPGQFGQLTAGVVTLAGPLNVLLTNGYVATQGSQFQILACSSLSGTFSSITVPPGISVSYATNGVFLTVTNGVVAPVQITSTHLSGGNFSFGFPTVSNQSYTVQENTNLNDLSWLFFTNFIGTGSPAQFVIPVGGAPLQFFRVREP